MRYPFNTTFMGRRLCRALRRPRTWGRRCRSASRRPSATTIRSRCSRSSRRPSCTPRGRDSDARPDPRTEDLDLGGSDSSGFMILNDGIPRSVRELLVCGFLVCGLAVSTRRMCLGPPRHWKPFSFYVLPCVRRTL